MVPSQPTSKTASKGHNRFPVRLIVVGGGVVGILVVGWFVFSRFSFSGEDSGAILKPVKRGEFIHLITESGNVESGNNVEIRCEVEAKGGGGSTILWIVAEGEKVKGPVAREKGIVSVKLDGSHSQTGEVVPVADLPPAVDVTTKKYLRASEIGRPEGRTGERVVRKLENGDGQPTYCWQLDNPRREFLVTADGKKVRVIRMIREPELRKEIRKAVQEQLNGKYAGAKLTDIRQIAEKTIKDEKEEDMLIYRMVADGKMELEVTAGQIVVELDSSALVRDMVNQEIVCNQSKANVIQAQNVYDTAVLAKKEYLGEDKIRAERAGLVKLTKGYEEKTHQNEQGQRVVLTPDFEIALLDPAGRKVLDYQVPPGAILYVEDNQEIAPQKVLYRTPGTYEVEEQKALEDLRRAADYLNYSMKLEPKGYVTRLQREADEFAARSAATKLGALREFTKNKKVGELDADIKTAEAILKAKEAIHELDVKELKRAEQQVEKCVIRSPQDGQVVYANISKRHGTDTVIDEGEKVRENQVIIKLPDPSKMQVVCKISEAKITLVEPGMAAAIHFDAFPELELKGTVEIVNELPEPTGWFSTGAKEYKTIVEVDPEDLDNCPEKHDLRPGLTAKVNILVESLPDVLQVPSQAVFEKGGRYYCLTEKKGKFQAHEVQIGSTNDEVVVIREGLAEGQKIVLHAAAHRDKVVVKTLVKLVGESLQVAAEAVLEHGKKHYCITEKRGKFKAHEVQIGSTDGEFVIISDGLTEGQEIVLHAAAYRAKVPELAEEEEASEEADSPKPGTPSNRASAPKPTGKTPEKGGDTPRGGPPASKSKRPKPGGDPFAKFDKNGDGKLVESEVPAAFWSHLKKADKNGDAAINRAELTAAMSKMRQGGGGKKPGAPGGHAGRPGAKP